MIRINLKNISIVLNILLLLMFIGYFIGHGLPQHFILWIAAILWLITPITNILYILNRMSK